MGLGGIETNVNSCETEGENFAGQKLEVRSWKAEYD